MAGPGSTIRKVFVAGHRGLAGSAVVRALSEAAGVALLTRGRAELDLTDAPKVARFLSDERPDAVVMCAARVGGIQANIDAPGEFIGVNLAIQQALFDGARLAGVARVVFLGSSCIYPRACPQPIREESLLTGPLEPTNRAYAVAKIAGVETCWAYNQQYGTRFCALMPTNLYGPGDNYSLPGAHVLAAFLRRFHEARIEGRREEVLWGTGAALREFMHSDDLGQAVRLLLSLDDQALDAALAALPGPPIFNAGSGEELDIASLATMVAETVGFRGRIGWDPARPDGTPRKLLDSARLRALGWHPTVRLQDGLPGAYRSFLREFAGA